MFGPLSLTEYERLLPGGLSFHRLVPIVRNYAGDVLIWDVNLDPARRGSAAHQAWAEGPPGLDHLAHAAPQHEPTRPTCILDASADSHAQRRRSREQQHLCEGRLNMTEISRVALFGKLNPIAYRAIEGATVFCKLRGNPYVEVVHWLHQILNAEDSDLHRLVRHFQIDPSRLAADLTAALDRLPRGATAISDFAPQIEEAIERGWVFATLMFGSEQVRTGHLLLAMVKTPTLRNALAATSRAVGTGRSRRALGRFRQHPPQLAGGNDDRDRQRRRLVARRSECRRGAGGDGQDRRRLAKFSVDLTQRARDGAIDAVTGRDAEIRQIIDVLMRRRQNNPILTGEAGVGKTAVVEGFALRIAHGDVPPALRDVSRAYARCWAAAGWRQHEGRVREPPASGDR